MENPQGQSNIQLLHPGRVNSAYATGVNSGLGWLHAFTNRKPLTFRVFIMGIFQQLPQDMLEHIVDISWMELEARKQISAGVANGNATEQRN